MGDQIAGINPAADGLGRSIQKLGRLFDREQGGQGMVRHQNFVKTHDCFLDHFVWRPALNFLQNLRAVSNKEA